MIEIEEIIQFITSRKRNFRFQELKRILTQLGFDMRQQKRGGSHYVFKHPKVQILVVLVSHGKNDPLPEYQVMKVIHAMQKLKSVTE